MIANRRLLDIALRCGLALGTVHKRVVIGRDTRTSGSALKHALVSGLLFSGARCYDAGVVPTPTLAIAAGEFDIGVMVTASHNPPEYNGIKIFNPDGSSYVQAQQERLEELLIGTLPTASWDRIEGDCLKWDTGVSRHIERILSHIKISGRTRVVIDCGCGAASVITPTLLRMLNCDVISLNANPSGFFPHGVEPLESNLQDLIRVCREIGAVGIAHDGDADRMMAVDEKGRFIAGDKMLVLLAQHLKAKNVVTTVDASMVVDEVGMSTVRTRVGDTYVSEQLRNWGDFGGEPSGAWVFPQSSLCPDGIFAAAMIVSIACENHIYALVDAIPQYHILRGSVPLPEMMPDLAKLDLSTKPARVDTTDGAKLEFEDGWALLRPSGTEPKMRLTVEAKSEIRAHQIYDGVLQAIVEANQEGGRKA